MLSFLRTVKSVLWGFFGVRRGRGYDAPVGRVVDERGQRARCMRVVQRVKAPHDLHLTLYRLDDGHIVAWFARGGNQITAIDPDVGKIAALFAGALDIYRQRRTHPGRPNHGGRL